MEKKARVINILVAGHAQHGKSSLIEAIVGKFPDNLDFELNRGTTISLKVIQFFLKKQNIMLNFLDSPGHADFKGSIALGLEFADILLLVISGKEGFQARTYWLYEMAVKNNIPIIIAATKMDLPNANIKIIEAELERLNNIKYPIIETSAKRLFGIEDLIKKISIYTKARKKLGFDLTFIILGFNKKKGLGDLISIGITSGLLNSGTFISEKIKVRQIFSLKGAPLKQAIEGDIVQISLNIDAKFELGTKYTKGKFLSPKLSQFLSNIKPRKEFFISIEDPEKFKLALDILENIKKIIPSFDFYVEKQTINILVLGDLQFEFIKERLEDLIEFKVIGSQLKGVITINSASKGTFNSASVRIIPRCKKQLTITRNGKIEKKIIDIIGATAAYDAFHLDGLHVDIFSGKNEEDIAQAIAKAIEKVKIIKIVPHQDVIVKVENYHDIYTLIERFNIEVLHQTQTNTFFLQVKNEYFESFFNSIMKVSQGKADIHLFKFEQDEVFLSVDPGKRHFGFCLIEKGELPSLWYVNLKKSLNDLRTHNVAKKHLATEMDIFLENNKDIITKIFIGNGPGSDFIIDFFIDYFNIPCEDYSCVFTDQDVKDGFKDQEVKNRFKPPELYLIDEFKTTKEAIFRLHQGNLVSEVQSKGFVDHAIAALLIAKRGLKGEILKIDKKPLKQLYDYVLENYAGTYSFTSIHNINSLNDIKPGTYLRVKDSSKLDSNLQNGDVIGFIGFGNSYNSIHATTL
ncbi:MAG: GTP-binding protein [Promethearchaeota archaeon]